MNARVLVAGVGDITLSDDGFGVEVVRRLDGLPAGVEVVDFGLRARDLAFQLLDDYTALVLVDAISRGAEPGTLYALEHDLTSGDPVAPSLGAGHQIDPDTVLNMIVELAAAFGEKPPARVVVVACEAASFDEGIGLSPPVAAAVERAVAAVREIATELEGSHRVSGHSR
ncbi:MAG: hydrogenase maturation protease [Pseudonocardia sp.]